MQPYKCFATVFSIETSKWKTYLLKLAPMNIVLESLTLAVAAWCKNNHTLNSLVWHSSSSLDSSVELWSDDFSYLVWPWSSCFLPVFALEEPKILLLQSFSQTGGTRLSRPQSGSWEHCCMKCWMESNSLAPPSFSARGFLSILRCPKVRQWKDSCVLVLTV